jgi:hypothetical protein
LLSVRSPCFQSEPCGDDIYPCEETDAAGRGRRYRLKGAVGHRDNTRRVRERASMWLRGRFWTERRQKEK